MLEAPRIVSSLIVENTLIPQVIPGRIEGRAMRNLNNPWEFICERAGLKDVRLHDCRHSYASRAISLGENLPMIRELLGRRKIQTTARYAQLARDSVKLAAEPVADSLAADLDTTENVSVVK